MAGPHKTFLTEESANGGTVTSTNPIELDVRRELHRNARAGWIKIGSDAITIRINDHAPYAGAANETIRIHAEDNLEIESIKFSTTAASATFTLLLV